MIFSLTAKGRVPARQSALLAYIAQLLLQSLAPVRNEIIEAGGTKDLALIFRDALAIFSQETQDFTVKDSDPLPFASPRQKRESRKAKIQSRRERIRDGMQRHFAGGCAKPSDLSKFDPKSDSSGQEEPEGNSEDAEEIEEEQQEVTP